MPQHVLLVLDGAEVHEESIFYARALAKRMDLQLSVLMLERPDASDTEAGRLTEMLETVVGAARNCSVNASGTVRSGDRASELLKHLAANPGTKVIVWGGDPGVLSTKHKKHAAHWLNRLRSQLSCPIAGAVGKSTGQGRGTE